MGKLGSKYLKVGVMLFFSSWWSGLVSVVLGQQGLFEFLGVFLFIVILTVLLLLFHSATIRGLDTAS